MEGSMVNRRRFLCAAAAAASVRVPLAVAAGKYDLVIKGGRVIDPASKLDAVRDIAVGGGKIVSVKPNIEAGGAETLDASGKLVVPGLIDIHTHAARAKEAAPHNNSLSARRSELVLWSQPR